MPMTETMQVLKLLAERGPCSLGHVVGESHIPTARVVASLGALTRAGEISKDAACPERDALYRATEQGAAKVAAWGAAVPRRRSGRG
ncbi:hypothetical protein [Streptomyces sp. NPDC001089]